MWLCRRIWMSFGGEKLSLVTLVLSTLFQSASSLGDNNNGCEEANRHFPTAIGHRHNQSRLEMPRRPIPGDHLQFCHKSASTCCSRELELSLVDRSSKDYQRAVQDKIVGLLHTFERRTAKFDRFFRDLLRKARAGLHDMFKSTYGFLYEQNADVFTSLFDSLTEFYLSGKVNLDEVMKQFYVTLYQRMFQLINRPHHFGPDYWDCVVKHMDTLKPFGDVPVKMSLQVRRSFVAARTFVQSLVAGQEVVNKIMMIPPSDACAKGLMRMTYCAQCHNLPSLKPCSNFCLNVVNGCLAYQTELDQEWNHYIDSLLRLLERLEGPFNIESVIDPIDVKISEAIMTFHDSGPEISQKVFAGCGQPPNAADSGGERQRRSAVSGHHNSTRRKSHPKPTQQQVLMTTTSAIVRPTVSVGTNLETLTRDIRDKIQLAKGFWADLPQTLCGDPKIASDQPTECWNGVKKDRYSTAPVADGLANQWNNPEVPVDPNRPDSVVIEQTLRLKSVTTLLQRAYSGNDVTWNGGEQIPKDVSAAPKRPKPHREFVEGSGDDMGDVGSGAVDDDMEVLSTTTFRPSAAGVKTTTFESDDEDLPGGKVDPTDEAEGSGNSPASFDGDELDVERTVVTADIEPEEDITTAGVIWGYHTTQSSLATERSTQRGTFLPTTMSTRRYHYTTPRWTTQGDRGRFTPDYAVQTATPEDSKEKRRPTSGTSLQLSVGRVLWLMPTITITLELLRR